MPHIFISCAHADAKIATGFAALLTSLLFAGCDRPANAEDVSEGKSILVFEKLIQPTDFVWNWAWSPDNRHLAILALLPDPLGPNVQVIDTADETATSRVVLGNVAEGSIGWSPDGQTIALAYWDGHFHGVKLASVRDAREIARRDID